MARSSKEQVSTGSEGGSVQRSAPSSRKPEQEGSGQQAETSVHPVEPSAEADDARKPGSSRRQGKVLQMNTRGGQAQQPKGTPAAQHATGSFTGTSGGARKKR